MNKTHHYQIQTSWQDELKQGTKTYTSYSRNHNIQSAEKPVIAASSDPAFRGENIRYNPEELLVASLSSCHMLWYLHLCADAGIVVTNYRDNASGTMEETANSGRFIEVTLQPVVTITDLAKQEAAQALHHEAHRLCFIANSVNFEVKCEAVILLDSMSS